MNFRFRRSPTVTPGVRLTDYATRWVAHKGLPLALELLAILVVVLAALIWAA